MTMKSGIMLVLNRYVTLDTLCIDDDGYMYVCMYVRPSFYLVSLTLIQPE